MRQKHASIRHKHNPCVQFILRRVAGGLEPIPGRPPMHGESKHRARRDGGGNRVNHHATVPPIEIPVSNNKDSAK